MRILSFTAENFKKIKVVEIRPAGRVTALTGRNGQGKTSVLDAIWALLAGKRCIPEKPVRMGAQKSDLSAVLSDEEGQPFLTARRTIAKDRTTSLTVEAIPGRQRPAGTHQALLDELLGQMAIDPIAFIHSPAKEQVEQLRKLTKIDVDFDALAAESKKDYDARTIVNRKVADLKAQAAAIVYSPGLPAERVDEAAIEAEIRAAAEANAGIVAQIENRIRLVDELKAAEAAAERNVQFIETTAHRMQELKLQAESNVETLRKLKEIRSQIEIQQVAAGHLPRVGNLLAQKLSVARDTADGLMQSCLEETEKLTADFELKRQGAEAAHQQAPSLEAAIREANAAWAQAPNGELIPINALVEKLQQAQLINHEIAKRTQHGAILGQIAEQQSEAARLTRAIEAREEKKRSALSSTKMPVEGLTFSDESVWFKGIPLEQLGEAEQIRVGCALAMAENPTLRCVPIAHGESLDDESLALIDGLAEEHNFQIFMARVDTSGKVGIVLEDGMVKAVNE